LLSNSTSVPLQRGTPLGAALAGTIDQTSLDLWSTELLGELDYTQEADNARWGCVQVDSR